MVPPGMKPDRQSLERLAEALGHRGPDGTAIAVIDSVGLVNTRLAIVDPSPAGDQPMADAETGLALTYNGEVFNHLELRRQLSDRPYRGASDTETVIRALGEWGPAALVRLNGFFALASLDARKGEVILARDRLGTKPLYWAQHAGAVWFASEIEALLQAGVPRVMNRAMLAKVLSFGWDGGEPTAIDGIRRVMPGTLVRIDVASLRCSNERWYDLLDEVKPELQAELAARSRGELRAMLDAELDAAVEGRLMGDAPVGTFCSGGLDSSLITAMARRKRRGISALVASLEDSDTVDEARYARLVARRLGLELDVVRVTPEGWRQAFVDAVRHHEAPLPNPTPVALSQLADAAHRHGIKAVLVGDGADTLFGANWGRHREAFRRVLPRSALYRRRAVALRRLGPRRAAAEIARRTVRRGTPPVAPVRFGGETMLEDAARVQAIRAYGGSGPRAELAGGLLADLSLTMPHLLNRWDGNAMQHAVEVRLPFLDRGVVSLALNLPLEARVMPRGHKGILSEVAAAHLPPAVLRRSKIAGLLLGSNRWIVEAARPEFLRDGMLREILEIDADRWGSCVDAAPGSSRSRCGRRRSGRGSFWRGRRQAPWKPSSGCRRTRQAGP